MSFTLKFVQFRWSPNRKLNLPSELLSPKRTAQFRLSFLVVGICSLPILGWSQSRSGGSPRQATPIATQNKPNPTPTGSKTTKTTPNLSNVTPPAPKPTIQRVSQKTAVSKPKKVVPKKNSSSKTHTPSTKPGPTAGSQIPTPIPETGNFRQDMLNAVNKLRATGCQCGNQYMPPVPPLRWNSQLEGAAIVHVRDMHGKGFMSHTGSDGHEFDVRIDREGYLWREVGENVARGQMNLHQVIMDWKKSPSHCKTMMNAQFREIGAARSGNYWVQDFGKPMR